MIVYERISNLMANYFSVPLDKVQSISSVKDLSQRLERDLSRQKTTLMCRVFFWSAFIPGVFIVCQKSKKIHPALTPSLGAVGLIHTIYSIHKLGERSLQIKRKKEPLLSIERKKNIPDFPLPSHIETMLPFDLEGFNRDQPIQYFVVAGGRVGISIDGGRIGISIDAGQIGLEELSCRLRIIAERYPHLSQIKILHFQGNVKRLIADLFQFSSLTYLSFVKCTSMDDDDLKAIDLKVLKLKRIDLLGCRTFSKEICENMETKYAITFPDGKSNLEKLFSDFYGELKKNSDQLLLKILNLKLRKFTEENLGENVDILSLMELEASLQTPQSKEKAALEIYKNKKVELMKILLKNLDLSEIDEDIKNAALEDLKSFISHMFTQRYTVVLGSKFHLEIKDIILCDELFYPLLEAFQIHDAYLTSLDISSSCLTGSFLEKAIGLPLETFTARNVENLDNSILKHLKSFSELKHLDFSDSVITSNGMLGSLIFLSKLKSLHLDRCISFSNTDFKACIAKLMFNGLELVTIRGCSQIKNKTVCDLIEMKKIDLTAPLFITVDIENGGAIYTSSFRSVDDQIIKYLEKANEKRDIFRIVLGEESKLDVKGLERLKTVFQIQFFEMKGNKIDAAGVKLLPKIWPLQLISFPECEIKISNLQIGRLPVADEIIITTDGECSSLIWSFLEAFHTIESLILTSSDGLIEKMIEICITKQIKQFSLKGNQNITNNDLEDLEGKPNPLVLKILQFCNSFDLEGTGVTEDLFSSWDWNLPNRHRCTVYAGNGNICMRR